MDYFPVFAFVVAMSLLTTLRFCVSGTLQSHHVVVRTLTHPLWLFSLGFTLPFVLGLLNQGKISPWPWIAYRQYAAGGLWHAWTAALAVTVLDVWLLFAAARAAAAFAPPQDRHVLRYYYVVNAAVGVLFIARGLYKLSTGTGIGVG